MPCEEIYGCLFCRSGKEKSVIRCLEKRYGGVEAITPEKTRRRRAGGTVLEERVTLLPGYVFFRTREEIPAGAFLREEYVLRLLTDVDGEWKLKNADLAFAEKFFSMKGNIPLSLAYFKGDRIRIQSGFLKDLEGSIVKVNKRAQTAQVRTFFQGKAMVLWLGYELMEKPGEEMKEETKNT